MASLDTKRVEDMNYFEMLAWLGIGSSHPGASRNTAKPAVYTDPAGRLRA